ncbi:GcrA family cell cycle regulator [Methylobacterium aquaticum]|uniref:GcrA family cell cycle regulator n=1 Tax=Methylobacterium aquaticum TaxID=270351 RepID=UPI003D167AB2
MPGSRETPLVPSTATKQAPSRALSPAAPAPTPVPSPVQAPASKPDPAGIPLAALGAFACHYAVTPDNVRPHQHRFCGAPALPGKSWCAEHADAVFSAKDMGGMSRAQAQAQARIRRDQARATEAGR